MPRGATMMQFSERDVQRLIWACQYRKDHINFEKKGAEYWDHQMDDLIHKLENYKEEMDCPDCWDPHGTCQVQA